MRLIHEEMDLAMKPSIANNAEVDPRAEIDRDVTIGPFCVIGPDVRNAIYQLHQAGMSLREISRRLHVSRNAVRRIVKQQGKFVHQERSDKKPSVLRNRSGFSFRRKALTLHSNQRYQSTGCRVGGLITTGVTLVPNTTSSLNFLSKMK